MFIDVLLPPTSSKAAHYRETDRRLSNLDVIDYASGEGSASREMGPKYHAAAKPIMLITKQDCAHSPLTSDFNQFGGKVPCPSNAMNLMTHRHRLLIDASATVPSSHDRDFSAMIMLCSRGRQPKMLLGQAISGLDPLQHPKWIDPLRTHRATAHKAAHNPICFFEIKRAIHMRTVSPRYHKCCKSLRAMKPYLLRKGYPYLQYHTAKLFCSFVRMITNLLRNCCYILPWSLCPLFPGSQPLLAPSSIQAKIRETDTGRFSN